MLTSHLDSYSNDPLNNAPGADDDGSGTAVVMECARILRNLDNPLVGIQFVPFSAEELGLIGSERYADYVYANSLPLLGVFNFDMVGYKTPDDYDFDIYLDSLSLFSQVLRFAGNNYLDSVIFNWIYALTYGSDHYPFAIRWYPWAFLIESNYHLNPNYHRTTDLVTAIDTTQMVWATKFALATALYFALLPLPPESLLVFNVGDGERAYLTWPRVGYPGETYTIYVGTTPDNLQSILEVTDTFAIVSGLQPQREYFFTVRTKFQGREGFGTPIMNLVLDSIPSASSEFQARSMYRSIFLSWRANRELDLANYKVYRSNDGTNFEVLRVLMPRDTFLLDTTASLPQWYYYFVTAVDSLGNEGYPSETLMARPVTLSEGLLVLDEFRNGTGTNPIQPNQSMQEAFCDTVLGSVGINRYEILNLDTLNSVSLSHVGVYSVLWIMSDDNTEFLGYKYQDALKEFINFGGKVIIEGYRNAYNLGLLSSYPNGVNGVDFGLSLDSVYLNTSTDFVRGYNPWGMEIRPNPAKLLSSCQGRLSNVEAYAVREGEVIYYFDSYSDNSVFEGRPCAVLFGDSVVLVGFPLYYMRTEDVVSFFNFLKSRGIGVREERVFSERKTIFCYGDELSLPIDTEAKVMVYDLQGRVVKVQEGKLGKLSLKGLRSGIYFVVVGESQKAERFKILKVR